MRLNRTAVILTALLLIGAIFISANYHSLIAGSLGYRTLSIGSQGSDVRELQKRLQSLGYGIGAADGIFGAATRRAVMSFQRSNNLVPDGVVGTRTRNAILQATGERAAAGTAAAAPAASRGGSYQANLDLLARLINGEARGEPYIGQVAVGAVVMNRVRHPSFPKTIAGVIFQPRAFDAVRDGQINMPPKAIAVRAAREAMNGWDPTGGALYYYNPRTASDRWIRTRPIIKYIGRHAFAR